eukprot:851525-Rhodomonas_salina.4
MPARYYSSSRNAHVLRPLIYCEEADIAAFASAMRFPILPCTLCGSQPNMQRARFKLLVDTLPALSTNARQNIITSMADVRPSHLLDRGLREACGLDVVTGAVRDARALGLRGWTEADGKVAESVKEAGEGQGSRARGEDVRWEAESEADDPLMAL